VKTLITAFLSLVLFPGATASVHAQGSQWEMLNNEAMSLYQKGQYGRAVMVAKKALDVADKGVGPDHPDVATSLNNLAALYQAQGQYAQAEPLFKRSLTII
jgi:Flp pilus assembly protein TadD